MPADLRFRVKTDLIIGGKLHTPEELRVDQDGQLARPAPGSVQPGKVTRFFLAAWLGAGSKQFSLCPINSDGTAEVRLTVKDGDPNTAKFAVAFNMAAPKGTRTCHLASSFLPISDLCEFLSNPSAQFPAGVGSRASQFQMGVSKSSPSPPQPQLGVSKSSPSPPQPQLGATPPASAFSDSTACFGMSDNFTRNAAVLRFADAGSDLGGLAKLRLKPSALLELDRVNGCVYKLGQELKKEISRFSVSPLNAGPQYMHAFTYGQMQGVSSHYALLGHAFSCMPTPVDLPWIMYDAYQAVQSTGLSPQALAAMSDPDLALRFGIPLISRHTSCSLTNIYCTDYTVSAVGQACKLRETEDIAQTYSCLSLLTQPGLAAARPYVPAPPRLTTIPECIAGVAAAQAHRRAHGLSDRTSFAPAIDDCENLSQAIMMKADGLRELYRSLGGSAGAPQSSDPALAKKCAALMSRAAAQTNPHLFSKLSAAHHESLAPAIVRLGRMLLSGEWSTSLGVVSAKGPSYDNQNPAASASSLSGHGTVISRVKDRSTGLCFHCPVEGTTYLAVDQDPPRGVARSVTVRLSDGSSKAFDHAELATVLAQNIHDLVGASCDHGMLAHLRSDYGADCLKYPFYVSLFYAGLSEGGQGSLGCVPLDREPPQSFQAGSRPLFGAPVMGLSRPSSVAVPVTADMLAANGGGAQVLDLIRAQVKEAWSPEVDPKTVATIASFWQPCEAPDHPGVCFRDPDSAARCIRSENTWAFDRPEHAAMAVQLYRELAENYNALQARDPASDGSRAHAFGQYLSASLRVTLPLPRAPQGSSSSPVRLSCIRNLTAAALATGISKVSACPLKSAAIAARARVQTDAHFYMCDRGGGPVHAHRVRLA